MPAREQSPDIVISGDQDPVSEQFKYVMNMLVPVGYSSTASLSIQQNRKSHVASVLMTSMFKLILVPQASKPVSQDE